MKKINPTLFCCTITWPEKCNKSGKFLESENIKLTIVDEIEREEAELFATAKKMTKRCQKKIITF